VTLKKVYNYLHSLQFLSQIPLFSLELKTAEALDVPCSTVVFESGSLFTGLIVLFRSFWYWSWLYSVCQWPDLKLLAKNCAHH